MVYFADDDNKYDLRLFVQVSYRPRSQALASFLSLAVQNPVFCTASDGASRSCNYSS